MGNFQLAGIFLPFFIQEFYLSYLQELFSSFPTCRNYFRLDYQPLFGKMSPRSFPRALPSREDRRPDSRKRRKSSLELFPRDTFSCKNFFPTHYFSGGLPDNYIMDNDNDNYIVNDDGNGNKLLPVLRFSPLLCLHYLGFRAVFTNLGKSDSKGPKSIGSHYTGQDHDGQVTLSSGIQLWTVPYTGEYRIEAIGAAGGYGEDSLIKNGGRGARMIGNFNLIKDEIIHILVGQQGSRTSVQKKTSGGGGGTFVVRAINTPLIIAGGGGGIKKMSAQDLGCDASINTTGNAGHKSPSGSGGSNGHGGNTAGEYSGKGIIFII